MGVGDGPRHEPVDLQQLLLDVSRLAASRRDLEGLLADLVGVVQKAFRFDGLAVVLHDPVRNETVLHSAGGVALPAKAIAIPPEADPAGVAWLTQQPIATRALIKIEDALLVSLLQSRERQLASPLGCRADASLTADLRARRPRRRLAIAGPSG